MIGMEAFQVCSSLERIKLPSTATEVNHGAFYGCSSLSDVVVNEGLRKVGGHAFAGSNMKFPSTVTNVGDHAFYGCDNLRDVLHKNVI
ncbi:hypothetical protein ACHAXR_004350 [Thalassiosira sp. AJA248-18]